jgi:hypothetical protein
MDTGAASCPYPRDQSAVPLITSSFEPDWIGLAWLRSLIQNVCGPFAARLDLTWTVGRIGSPVAPGGSVHRESRRLGRRRGHGSYVAVR